MKLGDQIHYDSTDEVISAVSLAYSQVKDINSAPEVNEAIGRVLSGLSDDDRRLIGQEFTRRMRKWDATNRGTEHNPYAGVAYHLDPPVGGS